MTIEDKKTVFDIDKNLFVQSETDNLYIMPWKLLHEGYEVTRQDSVVRVDPDAGVPITHSKFSTSGRIISAKIFVGDEPTFWRWYGIAAKNGAVPFWVYDARLQGYMRCTILDQPSLSPAGTSVNGCYVQIKLFAHTMPIPIISFLMENTPERAVTENDKFIIQNFGEVTY